MTDAAVGDKAPRPALVIDCDAEPLAVSGTETYAKHPCQIVALFKFNVVRWVVGCCQTSAGGILELGAGGPLVAFNWNPHRYLLSWRQPLRFHMRV